MRGPQTTIPSVVPVFVRGLVAMALFLSATVLVCVNCEAASKDSLADLVSNPQTWSNFDWSRPDESSVLRLDSWEQYSGRQEWTDRVLVKRQTIHLADLPFKALWYSVSDKSGSHKELVFLTDKFSREDCTQVFEWVARLVGQPYITVDRSFRQARVEYYDRKSEWELGATRILGSCLASSYPEAKGFVPARLLVNFISKAATKRARALVAVNCSRHAEYRGFDKAPAKQTDKIYVIDQDRQEVLDQSNLPLDGQHIITDTSVLIKIDDKAAVGNLEINRITGTYSTTLRSVVDATLSKVLSGMCEPIDLQRRKF